jgi:hypothetical protein
MKALFQRNKELEQKMEEGVCSSCKEFGQKESEMRSKISELEAQVCEIGPLKKRLERLQLESTH